MGIFKEERNDVLEVLIGSVVLRFYGGIFFRCFFFIFFLKVKRSFESEMYLEGLSRLYVVFFSFCFDRMFLLLFIEFRYSFFIFFVFSFME